ncbi:MAG: hypothetical protein AAGA30_10840 [Planctomycetota bacterium]
MNNHFLIETTWVMINYGMAYLVGGICVTAILAIWASCCSKRLVRLPILGAAVLAIWVAMFLAADSGYRSWQSSANAPEEAFSDTGPIFFLVAGWLPSAVIAYSIFRFCWWIMPQKSQSGLI